MGNVTIKDVAKRANVSITTVSLVLNNKAQNISKETIENVRRACRELNFERNHLATSLKTKVSYTIGLILPEIDNGYYSRIVSCLDSILSEKGYRLFTVFSNNDFKREIELYDLMVSRRVDYLLILPSSSSLLIENKKTLEEALNNIPIKFVILDRKTKLNHHVEVVNDDRYGASLAIEYLISKNHKRIACITGPHNVSSSDERLQGYKETLKKHNISFDKTLVYEGDYSFDKSRDLSLELLKRKDVDAVFAFNDTSAYALYEVCNLYGLKVGKDISVVGFDDNKFSNLISPSLTSIRQDIRTICQTAVKELFNDDNTSKVIDIAPTLVERESVSEN